MARKSSAILSMDESLPRKRANTRRVIGRPWLLLGLISAILALAWFDGGEEPIRAISQEISVPETVN
jgi:hypothetical protein